MHYHHVDVFTSRPYSGNSLAVFPDARGLSGDQMLAITQEMRHFESIFLTAGADGQSRRARVFDLVEEMDFAGHPVIGAACVLHASVGKCEAETWTLELRTRTVTVQTWRREAGGFDAVLDQGPPEFLTDPPPSDWRDIAGWFSLETGDLHSTLPPQVVSTGLRYLVLPVRGSDALARARIATRDLDDRLAGLGAQYAYLLDADGLEGRHWCNDGSLEDVATGSAAGCVAAYLRLHGRIDDGVPAILQQGRFVGRPSEITIRAKGPRDAIASVQVGGGVALVAEGQLSNLPQ